MASYETVLTVPQPVAETFAFVSNFQNAASWDPRTYSAARTTQGPIGVGTRFVLMGGLLPRDQLGRWHVSEKVAGMALPYDVVEFDAPNEFVLEGESRLVRYRDHLEFAPDGAGTRLRYVAELELKGALARLEPRLQKMFTRIGDDATRGIPAALERAV